MHYICKIAGVVNKFQKTYYYCKTVYLALMNESTQRIERKKDLPSMMPIYKPCNILIGSLLYIQYKYSHQIYNIGRYDFKHIKKSLKMQILF